MVPRLRLRQPVTVSDTPAPFGIEVYEAGKRRGRRCAGREQAGSHPFRGRLRVDLNQTADAAAPDQKTVVRPVGLPKDLHFKWPPGLIGNPIAVARCLIGLFLQSEW